MDDQIQQDLLNDPKNFAPAEGHRFVEIGYFEGSYERHFKEGSLLGKEIGGWLQRGSSFENAETADRRLGGGLRLVICSPRKLDYIWPLPLSKATLGAVLDCLKLPSLFLRAIYRQIPVAASYKPSTDENISGLILRTNLSWFWQYGLAVVHNSVSNITHALVVGLRKDEIDYLIEALRGNRPLSTYHMLLPCLLMDKAIDRLSIDAENRRLMLIEICTSTGQHDFHNARQAKIDEKIDQLNLDRITQQLTGLTDACAGIGAVCKTQLRFVEAVQDLGRDIRFKMKSLSERQNISMAAYEERLQFIAQLLAGIESKITYTKSSAQGQVQTMYSLISQKESRLHIQSAEASRRIADESRKIATLTRQDSIDMRIIAAVTLIFLPGTFTATLFSSSFFNFQPQVHSHVSAWVWLYWTVTILLTLFVLSAWWFFARAQNNKTAEELRRQSRRESVWNEDMRAEKRGRSQEHRKSQIMELRPYLGSVAGLTWEQVFESPPPVENSRINRIETDRISPMRT